jgi:hypothetical protein
LDGSPASVRPLIDDHLVALLAHNRPPSRDIDDVLFDNHVHVRWRQTGHAKRDQNFASAPQRRHGNGSHGHRTRSGKRLVGQPVKVTEMVNRSNAMGFLTLFFRDVGAPGPAVPSLKALRFKFIRACPRQAENIAFD